MQASTLRYQLPKKAIKTDCPNCGPKHRRTLSRYIDIRTGEALPNVYGRCDRESNCGYHLSPYHKTSSGMSYSEMIYQQWKGEQPIIQNYSPRNMQGISVATPPMPATARQLMSVPDEVFNPSLGRYERNQFARLLERYYGAIVANELLNRFQIGTSRHWNNLGACVFWLIDEQGRKRGGQIKLFDDTFHTVKYVDRDGRRRTRTSWVHVVLSYQYNKAKQTYPDWLTAYIEQSEFAPCLFGLQQLATEDIAKPIAIVEAPKTAVLCTPRFPQFIWLAIIGRSYLNAERLEPLKGRKIVLFPDLAAGGKDYLYWKAKAEELRQQGFNVIISDYLEKVATDKQRESGLDLADFLLASTPPYADQYTPSCFDKEEVAIRIQGRVIPESCKTDSIRDCIPSEVSKSRTIRLPTLIQHYWTLFGQPPLPWNKIAAHKMLLRCLESESQTAQTIVTTPAEWVANPGSWLRPDESQIERI